MSCIAKISMLALLGLLVSPQALCAQASVEERFTAEHAERFAKLALLCVHKEYPNKISHVLQSKSDAVAPSKLTPAFYGCYDWHSAVHGHWLLARLLKTYPDAEFAVSAREALARSLTADNVAGEIAYFNAKGRASFERPYGLAWLLQLDSELRNWDDQDAAEWSLVLRPLAEQARRRLANWLPKLSHPIRTGEHSQTAFAMGLMLDWAREVKDEEFERLVLERSKAFYGGDVAWPLRFEPSGQDFLSPAFAEADLMRRVLPHEEFRDWLSRFLPELNSEFVWLPAVATDRTDGKLAHLDGLNLSRAWMLEGVAQALSESDPRGRALWASARLHREAGLSAVTGAHYAGGHWLGSFAVYLVTARGY
jgi:hypothetical protein